MNIGVILPELGGYSTLSLEFLKWYRVMLDLGHDIYILVGKSRVTLPNLTIMADLYPDNEFNLNLSSVIFDLTDDDESELESIQHLSIRLDSFFQSWIVNSKLDIVIVENFFSVPVNLPVSFALYNTFQKVPCKKIIKHHDAFYRSSIEKLSNSDFIKKIILTCFPLVSENTYHVSSNRLIRSYLKEKCSVDSIIIPYVINFKEPFQLSAASDCNLSHSFSLSFSDKLLINFSDLLPSSDLNLMLTLLNQINDASFKIISIVREHKDYTDYYDYIIEKIIHQKLESRIIIFKEDEILNNKVDLDYLFSFSKGIISFDAGVGFGQPLHMAIKHKCPLLFCTKAKMDWLELTDLGCKLLPVSNQLSDQDIELINHYINEDLTWGEENYTLMKQYYSMNFLQYLLNSFLLRI